MMENCISSKSYHNIHYLEFMAKYIQKGGVNGKSLKIILALLFEKLGHESNLSQWFKVLLEICQNASVKLDDETIKNTLEICIKGENEKERKNSGEYTKCKNMLI